MERSLLPVLGVVLRANRGIGTGHLMRVRSLLPKLKEHAYLKLYVYAFDEALRPMCSDYDEVLTFESKEDILRAFKEQAQAHAPTLPKVIIIDDYAIDKSFEQELYEHTKLFVVDDLFDRPHQCHMLLDQTLITHEDEYRKLCNEDCELLLGSKYSLTLERFYPKFYDPNYQSSCTCGAHHAPLSYRALWGKYASGNDSLAIKANCSCLDGQAQPLPRVFISFGGADPVSACLSLTTTILQGHLYERYCFTMLAGAANKDYEAIKAQLAEHLPKQYELNFMLLHHCNDVADLLFKHDVAIGAYGGMFRERIAAALPTIGVIIADNQKGGDVVVEKYNLGLSLSLEELKDVDAVSSSLAKLLENATTYSANCAKVYDGQGLERIVDKVLSLLRS